jgi:hypothetical protein
MKRELRTAENAQSEVIGYSLLLGILVVGIGIVIVLAAPIIQDSKNEAYLKNVEQGFTVLDSKISLVSLGKSPSQLVQIYTQAGNIVVDNENLSRMTVFLSKDSVEYELYNESLGTIQYQLGEDKVAYEGGGVFRKYPGDSDPVMITPPEFHFNGETLTLPIIRVNSNTSIGGSGVISMYFRSNNSQVIFPKDPEFVNPLEFGKTVKVVIKSDYYKAWEKYIEERTEFLALSNNATKEVTVILNTKPNNESQDVDYPIDVYGLNTVNDSALIDFSFSLDSTEVGFAQFHLTLQTDTDPPFIIEMEKSGGLGPGGVTVFFRYGNFPEMEEWMTNVTWIYDDGTWNFNFIDTFDTAEYVGNDESWTWDDEDSPYNKTYIKQDDTDLPPVWKVVQHYMQEVGPTFSFEDVSSQPEKGYYIENSSFVLHYEVMPPRITYLHIVEHEIQATLA